MQLSATPYPYAFQNRLEVFLLGCSMLVVVLGVIYAFVAVQSVAVEAALLAVLFGSMGGAALYIVYKHCREKPNESKDTPAQAALQPTPIDAPPPVPEDRDSPLRVFKRLSGIGERPSSRPTLSKASSSCASHSGWSEDSPMRIPNSRASPLGPQGAMQGAMIRRGSAEIGAMI